MKGEDESCSKSDGYYLFNMLNYFDLNENDKQELYNYLLNKFEISFFYPKISIINYIRVDSVAMRDDNHINSVKFSIIFEGKYCGKYVADVGGIRVNIQEDKHDSDEDEDEPYKRCGDRCFKFSMIVVLAVILNSLISHYF